MAQTLLVGAAYVVVCLFDEEVWVDRVGPPSGAQVQVGGEPEQYGLGERDHPLADMEPTVVEVGAGSTPTARLVARADRARSHNHPGSAHNCPLIFDGRSSKS